MNTQQQIYDCVVIGGGPAGLSAATYLGRFNRTVVVIDSPAGGRWQTHEVNENYFGFPDGIPTTELRERGILQTKKFGAALKMDTIQAIQKKDAHFILNGESESYLAKTLIIATGVKDRFPQFGCMKECLGRSLFWCITCDGYKTKNKKVMVVGYTNEALTTAMQFLNYTSEIMVVTNHDPHSVPVDQRLVSKLSQHNIIFLEGRIEDVEGREGILKAVKLSTGQIVIPDFMFSMQGASPNSALARSLGVSLNPQGYIESTIEQRTNVTGVYAAGDVTKAFAHQIVTAAHEGATAAQAVNYDLYLPDQK